MLTECYLHNGLLTLFLSAEDCGVYYILPLPLGSSTTKIQPNQISVSSTMLPKYSACRTAFSILGGHNTAVNRVAEPDSNDFGAMGVTHQLCFYRGTQNESAREPPPLVASHSYTFSPEEHLDSYNFGLFGKHMLIVRRVRLGRGRFNYSIICSLLIAQPDGAMVLCPVEMPGNGKYINYPIQLDDALGTLVVAFDNSSIWIVKYT